MGEQYCNIFYIHTRKFRIIAIKIYLHCYSIWRGALERQRKGGWIETKKILTFQQYGEDHCSRETLNSKTI